VAACSPSTHCRSSSRTARSLIAAALRQGTPEVPSTLASPAALRCRPSWPALELLPPALRRYPHCAAFGPWITCRQPGRTGSSAPLKTISTCPYGAPYRPLGGRHATRRLPALIRRDVPLAALPLLTRMLARLTIVNTSAPRDPFAAARSMIGPQVSAIGHKFTRQLVVLKWEMRRKAP
jgi:hypothetical protein